LQGGICPSVRLLEQLFPTVVWAYPCLQGFWKISRRAVAVKKSHELNYRGAYVRLQGFRISSSLPSSGCILACKAFGILLGVLWPSKTALGRAGLQGGVCRSARLSNQLFSTVIWVLSQSTYLVDKLLYILLVCGNHIYALSLSDSVVHFQGL
jgi:hypothetical protein